MPSHGRGQQGTDAGQGRGQEPGAPRTPLVPQGREPQATPHLSLPKKLKPHQKERREGRFCARKMAATPGEWNAAPREPHRSHTQPEAGRQPGPRGGVYSLPTEAHAHHCETGAPVRSPALITTKLLTDLISLITWLPSPESIKATNKRGRLARN